MFEEINEIIFKLDLHFSQHCYIDTVNKHYGCCFLQSCCKPCHLLVYFVENLVLIYLNNAKDILSSFLDFAVDFKGIDKNKTKICESSFVIGTEKAHSLLLFLFYSKRCCLS